MACTKESTNDTILGIRASQIVIQYGEDGYRVYCDAGWCAPTEKAN
jgi:hypothetical protein